MQKALALKCAIIVGIGLALLIPLVMISGKIEERRHYLYEAQARVAQSWTGEQTIVSPLVVLPYQVEVLQYRQKGGEQVSSLGLEWHKVMLVPDNLTIKVITDTQLRHQGIYNIPVYSSQLSMEGELTRQTIEEALQTLRQQLNFRQLGEPYLAISIADSRGIDGDPSLTWQQQSLSFLPNSDIDTLESGLHSVLPALDETQDYQFQINVAIRGMQSLQFVPAAKQLFMRLQSSWPHPQFSGAFLPLAHDISNQGFSAEWRLNHFSTGIKQLIRSCESQDCSGLNTISFGVNFIDAVDPYLQAERSLKYGILFIGLSFIAFFMFETLRSIAIHPVQYTLVGIALAIFFLLLTSLSEHLQFALSYLIATAACVGLLGYYLRFVLGSWRDAIIFSFSLTILYAVLFIIVGAEDYALLMGSSLIFVVLAGIMISTRNINWYALKKVNGESN